MEGGGGKRQGHYVYVYIKSSRWRLYEATPGDYLWARNDLPLPPAPSPVKSHPIFQSALLRHKRPSSSLVIAFLSLPLPLSLPLIPPKYRPGSDSVFAMLPARARDLFLVISASPLARSLISRTRLLSSFRSARERAVANLARILFLNLFLYLP